MGFRQFVPIVAACPGCGRTTSTVFQELAQKIQDDICARTCRSGARNIPASRAQGRGDGLHRQRTGREQACRYRHLAARHRRDAAAPVFIDGKKAADAARPQYRREFEKMVADYIEKRFGRAQDHPLRHSIRCRPTDLPAEPAERRRSPHLRPDRDACRGERPAESFFARLIWKESRFDPECGQPGRRGRHRPVHAGHGQMRGLADPSTSNQAIPASAKYLGELKTGFGNLGLAAAAYNAGETASRAGSRSGGFLPLETENYVLDIMGEPADNFSDRAYAGTVQAARPKRELSAKPAATCPSSCRHHAHGAHPPEAVGHPGRRQFPPRRRDRQWQRLAAAVPGAAVGASSRW
jgi:hypothetical protein